MASLVLPILSLDLEVSVWNRRTHHSRILDRRLRRRERSQRRTWLGRERLLGTLTTIHNQEGQSLHRRQHGEMIIVVEMAEHHSNRRSLSCSLTSRVRLVKSQK